MPVLTLENLVMLPVRCRKHVNHNHINWGEILQKLNELVYCAFESGETCELGGPANIKHQF